MGVYTRRDSPVYWLLLDGFQTPSGKPVREPTKIRVDASTPSLRRDNKQLAEEHYHARMAALARQELQPGTKPAITFRAFAGWFALHVLPKRRGRERETEILPRLIAFFGTLPLSRLDRAKATEYATARLTTPTLVRKKKRTAPRTILAGPNTVNREIDLLKAILQAAVPKYLAVSPLYGMKRLPTPTPKRRLLTESEEQRLLRVMAPDDKALFLIGEDSLVRLSDVLDVTWEDRHGDKLWIADPKAGGGFEVPLSRRTQEALDAVAMNGSPYIFARRRVARTERDRRGAVRQMLARACRLATPPVPYGRAHHGITFHWATRRTGTTRMLVRNVDPGTVQKVGRWKTPDVVLGIYHELIDAHARRAVESVGPITRGSRKKKKTRKQA